MIKVKAKSNGVTLNFDNNSVLLTMEELQELIAKLEEAKTNLVEHKNRLVEEGYQGLWEN